MGLRKPRVGVGVIIRRDYYLVLLGKRKNAHGDGTWSFPGGHLNFFETLEKCAKREVREETGLEIDVVDWDGCVATNDLFEEENKHYLTAYVRANYIGGTPRVMEPEKCEIWKWFSWNSLPNPLFLPIQNLIKLPYNPFKE